MKVAGFESAHRRSDAPRSLRHRESGDARKGAQPSSLVELGVQVSELSADVGAQPRLELELELEAVGLDEIKRVFNQRRHAAQRAADVLLDAVFELFHALLDFSTLASGFKAAQTI